jgi:chromosome segregation and condensation protein ScpB
VKAKPKRKSIELTTTKKFIETFGIDARSRQDVKAWLEGQLEKMSGKKPA